MTDDPTPPPPSWTTCPEPTCRGAVRERAAVDPAGDGDVFIYLYCSSCGHLV